MTYQGTETKLTLKSGKPTSAFWNMRCAADGNLTVTRSRGGHSDYQQIQQLVRAGLCEAKPTGPRGGVRYHATALGRKRLEEAEALVSAYKASAA